LAATGSDAIGIGIIGSGGIAQGAHLPAYRTLQQEGGVRIVAVSDINEETARSAARQFEVENVYHDYRSLLDRADIDAVSVCTPNFLHRQPTVDALLAGKHVLVEKPLAMNGAEGREMVETARRAGRKLQVGFMTRFGPGAQALKRFIDAGDMGQIYYARAQALRRRGIPAWGVFTQKDKQGGGPLIDIGVHILDLTLWLMGHPRPVSASGAAYTKFGTRSGVLGLMGQWDPLKYTVEDLGVGFVRFENGASLTLEASFAANLEKDVFTTELLGTEGGCSFSPLKMFFERNQTLIDATPVFLPKVNSHEAEIRAFVAAVRDDTEVPVPGEQGLMVTQVLDAIYRSAEEGREVAVD
jgi:predicted dehydrogenase